MTDPTTAARIWFSAYLLHADLDDPVRALAPEHRPGQDPHVRSFAVQSATLHARAFVRATPARTPDWATNLAAQIDELRHLRTSSNGLVIIAPVGDRKVAFAFGLGWRMLDPEAFEWNFGLKVGARTLDPDRIKQTEARTLDASARTRVTSFVTGQQIGQFGFDFDGDWVRRLSGRTRGEDGEAGDLVSAGDSYRFRCAPDIAAACRQVERYLTLLDQPADETFEFIDNLIPLRPGSQVDALNAELLTRLSAGTESGRTILAPTEWLDCDDVAGYLVSRGHAAPFGKLDELDIEELVGLLGGHRAAWNRALTSVYVEAVDHAGDSRLRHPLRRWLLHGTQAGEDRYIFTLGRWFQINTRYVGNIDRRLDRIPALNGEPGLPRWNRKQREDAYNEAAARALGAVCLDKRCGHSELGATPVEFCDLLLPDSTFVHVKRADGSQSLSHLFAQGSTSTVLLARNDERFRADLHKILATRAPRHPVRATLRPTGVVYAIGTRSGLSVHDALFTIAKVALLAHSEVIIATGTPLYLTKIQRT